MENYPTSVFVDSLWKSVIFDNPALNLALGSKLGINYVRTLQKTVNINFGPVSYDIVQSSSGLNAISDVVWDCGLYLVDVINTCIGPNDRIINNIGHVIELGCGTGLVGMAALMQNAHSVLFSDMSTIRCLEDNLSQLPDELRSKSKFASYDWNDEILPAEFSMRTWDTILCSDVLYDEKNHAPLHSLLRRLKFRQLVISYKIRHEAPEMKFFESLSEWCDLKVVDPTKVTLCNLPASSLPGLYVIIATPRTGL